MNLKINIRQWLNRVFQEDPGSIILFIHILCFSLQVYWAVNLDHTFKYVLGLFVLLAIVSIIYSLLKWKISLKTVILGILGVLLFPLLYMWVKTEDFAYYISNRNIKLMINFILDIIVFFPFYLQFFKPGKISSKNPALYYISLVAFLFYIFIYQPVLYYFSSPGFTEISLSTLLSSVMMPFSILCIFFAVLYLLIPLSGKMLLTRITVCILFCSLLWSIFLRLKVGLLDVFILQFPERVSGMSVIFYLLDPIIITILWICSGKVVSKYRGAVSVLFIIFIAFHLVNLFIQYQKIDFSEVQKMSYIKGEEPYGSMLPMDAGRNHVFSRDKTNVVYVIADMFNGNYIGRIIEEFPEYKEKLDGFIWYPECLAISGTTVTSYPGIFGGYDNIPIKLNENDKTGTEEIREAARFFFTGIKDSGYSCTVADPYVFLETDTAGAKIVYSRNYNSYWEKKNGIYLGEDTFNMSSVLVMLSIFNCAPYHLKNIIYDNSYWIILRGSVSHYFGRKSAIDSLAYIDLLPEISSVNNSGGSFIYIYNHLPHTPYGINKDGNVISNDFPDDENKRFDTGIAAYHSAKKCLDVLINWFEWMKQQDVYDNTVIMVVSDHGNLSNDNGITYTKEMSKSINNPSIFNYDASRANALLLMKNAHDRGNVKIDTRPISSAEITYMLQESAGISFYKAENLHKRNENQPLVYSMPVDGGSEFQQAKFTTYRHYRVTGSIFAPNSWERME